jgi:hypothetical protein
MTYLSTLKGFSKLLPLRSRKETPPSENQMHATTVIHTNITAVITRNHSLKRVIKLFELFGNINLYKIIVGKITTQNITTSTAPPFLKG